MQELSRQRIKYLVEHGGLYPADEPASKNFVLRWLLITAALHAAVEYAVAILR